MKKIILALIAVSALTGSVAESKGWRTSAASRARREAARLEEQARQEERAKWYAALSPLARAQEDLRASEETADFWKSEAEQGRSENMRLAEEVRRVAGLRSIFAATTLGLLLLLCALIAFVALSQSPAKRSGLGR